MSYTPVTNNPIDDTTPFPLYGPTTARPPLPYVPQFYWDTTLDEPIWWNGANWINGAGAVV
jgi:hypothetical protein